MSAADCYAICLKAPIDSLQSAASLLAKGLSQWCEGFLHGLVSDANNDETRKRLAEEPLSDIIRDLVELTRAVADDDEDSEENAAAMTEIVEYLRVAAQLVYEELAELREPTADSAATIH